MRGIARKKRKAVRGHTGSALIMVENVSDGNWNGSEETLVVALELALIKSWRIPEWYCGGT